MPRRTLPWASGVHASPKRQRTTQIEVGKASDALLDKGHQNAKTEPIGHGDRVGGNRDDPGAKGNLNSKWHRYMGLICGSPGCEYCDTE